MASPLFSRFVAQTLQPDQKTSSSGFKLLETNSSWGQLV